MTRLSFSNNECCLCLLPLQKGRLWGEYDYETHVRKHGKTCERYKLVGDKQHAGRKRRFTNVLVKNTSHHPCKSRTKNNLLITCYLSIRKFFFATIVKTSLLQEGSIVELRTRITLVLLLD